MFSCDFFRDATDAKKKKKKAKSGEEDEVVSRKATMHLDQG